MTWEISIQGQVQGVGFRPFVWRAAIERNLKGSVANGLQGVLIKINGTELQAVDFQQYILENAPKTARIVGHSREPIPALFFDNFTIEESTNEGLPLLLLTPDVAICNSCRTEIQDPVNRRHGYAFTTCTVCGPRYSILQGLPYDRALTTMRGFAMCKSCQLEYDDPKQSRYFAQTNSCPDCGVQMQLFDCREGHFEIQTDSDHIIEQAVAAWRNGAILAIKGIGGYLLTCDATNPLAVATLRARKHRPCKPFALMYPNAGILQADVQLSDLALQHLQSAAAPILLLELLAEMKSGIDHVGIAPGLRKIGAMLPNAPLFELLLHQFGKPIVATSGNISNSPLIYEDESAQSELRETADFVLTHNRNITMPQDDSVLSLRKSGKQTLLRRARGFAPAFIQPGLQVPPATVLALGAELKSSFCLAHLGHLNISQYLGDLEHFETQQRYDTVLRHLLELYKAQPALVIGDLHPRYFTTTLGQTLAEKWQVPFVQVQHHKAHFAAVLAENELLESNEPILGVIWDGTGLGDDGQIWGGEFLVYDAQEKDSFQRCGHFDYFPLLLGDKMPREPRLSALSICREIAETAELLRPKFTEPEWNLYPKILLQKNQLMTSSVGRLFDAVASLLGLADKVSYEGEAALLLEDLGRRFYQVNGLGFDQGYPLEIVAQDSAFLIKARGLLVQILSDLEKGLSLAYIAAKFHFSMVLLIEKISNHLKIKKIACSGGVFQNTLLVDMMEQYFPSDYQLYFHQQLSPNDENIAFGQWAYAMKYLNPPINQSTNNK
jgi:hydrogenase maturation protein HypF